MCILKLFHFTNFWKKIIRHLGLNFQLLIKTFKSLEEQNALNRCDISADPKQLNTITTVKCAPKALHSKRLLKWLLKSKFEIIYRFEDLLVFFFNLKSYIFCKPFKGHNYRHHLMHYHLFLPFSINCIV